LKIKHQEYVLYFSELSILGDREELFLSVGKNDRMFTA